jgi:hypothetical protein
MEKQYTELATPRSSSSMKIFQWANLKNGDTGVPLFWQPYAYKSVHVKGTFGAGGSLQIEGSNDVEGPPNWLVLRNPRGGSHKLVFTAAIGADIGQVMERTYLMRPNVTGGDDTTDLIVTILISR